MNAAEAVVCPVPPFPIPKVPVMALAFARSRAPQAYVEAPVTRSDCPTVDELAMAVAALAPFPCMMPVKVPNIGAEVLKVC